MHIERALYSCVALAACAITACAAEPAEDAEVCDILESACQHQVLEMVAAQRGGPVPLMPKFEILPRVPDPRAQALPLVVLRPDDPEPARRAAWDAAFAALHVLPPGTPLTAATERQVSDARRARYQPATRTILLYERRSALPPDPRGELGTLAHELTHYLQDVEQDLTAIYGSVPADPDGQASVRALIEGEASTVGWGVQARASGTTPEPAEWDRYFDELESSYLGQVSASNAPLSAALDYLPYVVGARRIAALWQREGRGAIDALFRKVPDSIAAWLAAAPGKTPLTAAPASDCPPPQPPAGFSLLDRRRLGPLGALALTAAADSADMQVASRLIADGAYLYRADAPDAAPAVLWRLQFVDEDAARAFERAILPLLPRGLTYSRRASTLAVAAGVTGAQAEAPLLEAISCAPPHAPD